MSRYSMRRLAASLFLAVLGGVLLGCGGGEKPEPVAQNNPPVVAPSPIEPAKPADNAVDAKNSQVDEVTGAVSAPLVVPATPIAGEAKPHPGFSAPTTEAPRFKVEAERLEKRQEALQSSTKSLSEFSGRSGSSKDGLGRDFAGGGKVRELGIAANRPAAGGPVAQAPAANPADPTSSAESYNLYRENEFRSPLVAALSTFSADVNTASYSNVRRFLSSGQMPPKDAVFLAEFVNYFPYDYAKPKGKDPIAFNLELGPCPWNRKHHLVRVGVQASQIDPKDMPARKLTFLIDTSGSMSGPTRLPLVKQSLGLLIDQLTDKDTVGLVTYAGTAGVALPPTSGKERETIRAAVNGLGAGGSTNGEGGLKAAYELARQTFDEKAVNRVILCTDGDFNVGVSNQGDLVRMIEDQRKSGVFLTILGYGMGNYKDGTLKELANHGNGHHAYIDTLDEAKKVFVEQGGALVLVAKDVKFQVEFNPARVAAYRLVGYENRLLKDEDFRNDAKDAGDMGSGHQVTVLYEIVPVGVEVNLPKVDATKYTTPAKANPAAPDEWLTVKMRFKRPDSEKSTDADELAQALKGDAKVKDLSADFEFAAATASFGMLLRDSEFKGGMTYAGVIEMAQGAVGTDTGGHRKAFVELVKQAHEIAKPKAAPVAGSN